MTWKQFKTEVEAKGVTDDMEIFFIDTHLPDRDSLDVTIAKDGEGLTVTSF